MNTFFDDKTSIVASYVSSTSNQSTNTLNSINQSFNGTNNLSERVEDENEVDDSNEFSINFSKEFDKKGHILTLDYQKEKSNEIESSFISNTQIIPDFVQYNSEKNKNR